MRKTLHSIQSQRKLHPGDAKADSEAEAPLEAEAQDGSKDFAILQSKMKKPTPFSADTTGTAMDLRNAAHLARIPTIL